MLPLDEFITLAIKGFPPQTVVEFDLAVIPITVKKYVMDLGESPSHHFVETQQILVCDFSIESQNISRLKFSITVGG